MTSSRSFPSDGRASLSTGRAVRLGVVTGLLSFALLLVASRLWRSDVAPPRRVSVRPHDAEVAVWVGELAPGVKTVLSSPWNQREWDAAADVTLRSAPGTAVPSDLVLYDCWLFNTTAADVTVRLGAGALVVDAPVSGTLPLRSLAPWLSPADGRAGPSGGAASVLRALGAGREEIVLPPGRMHRHPVALERRVPLGDATGVRSADGTAFRLRRMKETEWAALIQSPRLSDLENL